MIKLNIEIQGKQHNEKVNESVQFTGCNYGNQHQKG